MSFQNKCEYIDIYGAIGRQMPLWQSGHATIAGCGKEPVACFVCSPDFGIEQAQVEVVFGVMLQGLKGSKAKVSASGRASYGYAHLCAALKGVIGKKVDKAHSSLCRARLNHQP